MSDEIRKPIQVRLYEEERAEIEEAATRTGVAVSTYTRIKSLEAARAET